MVPRVEVLRVKVKLRGRKGPNVELGVTDPNVYTPTPWYSVASSEVGVLGRTSR